MSWLSSPEIWASLLTLTVLEIVLGIDNLVFIAILAARVPPERRARARRAGLALALITRLGLLATIVWITHQTAPLFELFGRAISWRDLVLLIGGFFLLFKGTREIHDAIEGDDGHSGARHPTSSFAGVVAQIVMLDIVFSLDSVITAVGMANDFWVMATAVAIAVAIMLVASGPLAVLIEKYPTVRMLALSFLLLVGMTLIADGAGFHVPRGYVYAVIAFSIGVEVLNQVARRRRSSRRAAAKAPQTSDAPGRRQ